MRPLALATLLALCAAAPPARAQDAAAMVRARAEGRFIRALTRQYLRDDSAAVRLHTQALALRPGDPAILDALAEVHAALGQTTDALYHATLAAEAAPEQASVHLRLGRLLADAGQSARAIVSLETAARLAPRDLDAATALATAYEQAGRSDDARARLAPFRAAGLLPPEPSTRAVPATASNDDLPGIEAFLAGRYAEAADALLAVLADDPRRLDAWALALDALARSADPRSGTTADDATLLFPTVLAILAPAAEAYLAAGRPADARAAAQAGLAALDTTDDDPALRARLQRALAAAGRN
jgi:predicted Zn-dependent protease